MLPIGIYAARCDVAATSSLVSEMNTTAGQTTFRFCALSARLNIRSMKHKPVFVDQVGELALSVLHNGEIYRPSRWIDYNTNPSLRSRRFTLPVLRLPKCPYRLAVSLHKAGSATGASAIDGSDNSQLALRQYLWVLLAW